MLKGAEDHFLGFKRGSEKCPDIAYRRSSVMRHNVANGLF
ncbi:hypothetical protein HMPREF9104_00910 [Lentilactobacillus kisonensis F0435]|uniref:Uncharacterized protein n=1 Tax=Lentilactobacillus kisonensis F0435 TaxID=797516 RepID=H1LE84_9LACO|nr:hypothetical protein HMPREF9104_00910 [Lentilactobacillus kisonensis F0435]